MSIILKVEALHTKLFIFFFEVGLECSPKDEIAIIIMRLCCSFLLHNLNLENIKKNQTQVLYIGSVCCYVTSLEAEIGLAVENSREADFNSIMEEDK